MHIQIFFVASMRTSLLSFFHCFYYLSRRGEKDQQHVLIQWILTDFLHGGVAGCTEPPSWPLWQLHVWVCQGVCSFQSLGLIKRQTRHKPMEAWTNVPKSQSLERRTAINLCDLLLQPLYLWFYQHSRRVPYSLPPSTCHHQLANTPGSQAQAKKVEMFP